LIHIDKFNDFMLGIVNCNVLFIEFNNPTLTLPTREGIRLGLIPSLVGRVRVGLYFAFFWTP
jgi:hypothetical protein